MYRTFRERYQTLALLLRTGSERPGRILFKESQMAVSSVVHHLQNVL